MAHFDLRPQLMALIGRKRASLVELVVPLRADPFSVIASRATKLIHRSEPSSSGHGITSLVAALDFPWGSLGVSRTSLEADVDAATWLELTLRDLEGRSADVLHSAWRGLPCGDAVVASAGALVRWRTVQSGRALWTLKAMVPHDRWEASRSMVDLAVESFTLHRSQDLAEPLDAVLVRRPEIVARWPQSWTMTAETDVADGLAATLTRRIGDCAVGTIRLMVGAASEESAMMEDAHRWRAEVARRGGASVDLDVRAVPIGSGVLVAAIAGPARRLHAAAWATNRRAFDIVLTRSTAAHPHGADS